MRIEAKRNPRDMQQEAQAYLDATDWLVLEHVETGKAIPKDVLTRRAQARAAIRRDDPRG